MTYNQFDVVVVPFPFADSAISKRRPAIIISSKDFNQESKHCIMAMITSARNLAWPCDINITNLTSTGLKKASVIRMKLFTIDQKLILESCGILSKKDQKALCKTMSNLLGNVNLV